MAGTGIRPMILNGWQSLSLLVHLVAVALWLGGGVFYLIVFGPATHELRSGAGVKVLNQGRTAFETVSWAAIGLLMITGIINLIWAGGKTGPAHGEFYTIALSIKLFLFLAMLLHHCLQVFKYAPRIAALTAETGTEAASWREELRGYWQKWFLLLKINVGLGAIAVLLGLAMTRP